MMVELSRFIVLFKLLYGTILGRISKKSSRKPLLHCFYRRFLASTKTKGRDVEDIRHKSMDRYRVFLKCAQRELQKCPYGWHSSWLSMEKRPRGNSLSAL